MPCRSLMTIMLVMFLFVSCSASRTGAREASAESQEASQQKPRGEFDYWVPYRVALNSPFLIRLRPIPETGCSGKSPGQKGVTIDVHLQHTAQVEYGQETFSAVVCKNNYIKATVKNKGSGLVHFVAFADGYSEFDSTVDVGFDGKVRLTQTAPLSYNEPGPLNVEVVDQDGKALSFDNGLSIELASVDRFILDSAEKPHWGPKATLEMAPGARSSPPFSIKSQNLYGGNIHLTTSLKLGDVILSQENHSFEVTPARWLPILSAIFGALLYSLFSIVNDEKRSKILEKIGTGIVAGTIAWLFTGFDILGLKLDMHSLRTYTITGFLFAFFGVDVLLSKKFPRTVQVDKE